MFSKLTKLFIAIAIVLLAESICIAAAPVTTEDPTGLSARFNAVPDNPLTHSCKRVTDCKCPKSTNPKILSSTSCINGKCSCNNAAVSLFGQEFLKSVIAIGNAPITKAVSNLMKGMATVEQVAGTIVGAFLPPPAKAALKVALLALPNTGPSFLDDAKKKVLTKGL